jgi:hypothetical protein
MADTTITVTYTPFDTLQSTDIITVPSSIGGSGDGYTGSKGDTGYTGSNGYTGSLGYTGSKGDTGYNGSKGDAGYTGSLGYTGSKGDTGYTGSRGDTGYDGSFGYTGSKGDIGYTGSLGYTGSKGDTGYNGSFGATGYTGSQGATGYDGSFGYTGSKGDIGYTGSKGDTGYNGSFGYSGSKGDVGYTGSQGVGYTGSQGVIGYTGSGFANNQSIQVANLSVTNDASFSANIILGTTTISANGGVGSAGQVLTSGATGNVYWSTVATSGGFTNGQSIQVANLDVTNVATFSSNISVGTITSGSNANVVIDPNGTGIVIISNASGGAVGIDLGTPTLGNLTSNALSLTTNTSVTNGIAQLNQILGKLVPPSPSAFPGGQAITIQTLSTYRMTSFTQTDNTTSTLNVANGASVTNTRRAATYSTSSVSNTGPGDSGKVTAYLNGADAGNTTLTSSLAANGTYSNLVISFNRDINAANAQIAAGFWGVFTANASGSSIPAGWNEVMIGHSGAGNTNKASWYYDSSAPGTPVFGSVTMTAPVSPSYTYSSTVPHYNNTNSFTLSFTVNKLSGDMYPTSDNFIIGTSGGAFSAPASVSYTTAGITTPLARNLYVSSGNVTVNTTAAIISGFGSSSSAPSVNANNSYNNATQSFSPGATVLYKTGIANSIEEANVSFGSTVGSGSGVAARIINPGSTDTPAYSANATSFNSQSGTLEAYDATMVAAVLKHDQTNYSTGYLPAGPNLSSGRTSAQYFTFKFVRTSVSKFDIKWTGTIAGLFVALPGSTIDSTSTLNGWLDLSLAAGAGVPGANTAAGGNGSNGGSVGGVAPLNSAQTNKSITTTFGTVSSSSTATNEIYVRIKLTSGQSVTALSLQTASN